MAGHGYYPRTELVGEHPKLLDPEEARTGFHGSSTDLRGGSIVPQEAPTGAEGTESGLRRRWSMSSPQHVNYVTHNSSMQRSGPSSPWSSRDRQHGRREAEETAWMWAASGDPATAPGTAPSPGDGRPRVYEGVAEGEVGGDANLTLTGTDVSNWDRDDIPMAASSFRVTDTRWIPPGKPGRAVQGTLPGINWNQFGAPNVGNPEDVVEGLTKEDKRHAAERVLESHSDRLEDEVNAKVEQERRARPDYQAGRLRKAVEDPAGQLPLFAMAKDLKGAVKILDGDREMVRTSEGVDSDGVPYEEYRPKTDDEVWEQKLQEASIPGRYEEPGRPPSEWPSLREDIAKHGMYRPVTVSGVDAEGVFSGGPIPAGTVLNGHHRIAAVAADSPESWVPLEWSDQKRTTGGSDADEWVGPNSQAWMDLPLNKPKPGRGY